MRYDKINDFIKNNLAKIIITNFYIITLKIKIDVSIFLLSHVNIIKNNFKCKS